MPPTYCEVALPVPLRSLFTYEVPERLAGSICAGSRVLVPFRNRAMAGVVVEASVRRPDPARVKNVREIAEVLDAVPALPPSLVELGRWVGGYYVAPLGEVFRNAWMGATNISGSDPTEELIGFTAVKSKYCCALTRSAGAV